MMVQLLAPQSFIDQIWFSDVISHSTSHPQSPLAQKIVSSQSQLTGLNTTFAASPQGLPGS